MYMLNIVNKYKFLHRKYTVFPLIIVKTTIFFEVENCRKFYIVVAKILFLCSKCRSDNY